jgi:hypothetical protein
MASSTKMTLTLTHKEAQALAEVLDSARESSLHSARYRMNAIQLDQQTPFSEISKPAASTLGHGVPNYYEWEDLYKALKKIEAYNSLLNEFGYKAEYPEVEEFVPRSVEDATV